MSEEKPPPPPSTTHVPVETQLQAIAQSIRQGMQLGTVVIIAHSDTPDGGESYISTSTGDDNMTLGVLTTALAIAAKRAWPAANAKMQRRQLYQGIDDVFAMMNPQAPRRPH